MTTQLQAFRLDDGPCDGEIAELPPDGYDVWRSVHAPDNDQVLYASYQRDGAVFRYDGRTVTMPELAALCSEHASEVKLHIDSREYER